METNVILVIVLLAIPSVFMLVAIVNHFRRAFLVPEGYVGLLYHKGKFVTKLAPGEHVRWGRGLTIDAQDVRKTSLAVPAQEVLTADSVSVKFGVLVTYQIIDPVKAAHDTQNWRADLYNTAQLALRAVIGGVTIEALLGQRPDFASQLLARVQPEALNIGISVSAVEIKDVTLPPDLKRAFSDVLKAKQEGQASLERARGESAALRNLANGARVLENNPALMNLRLMQSLAMAQKAGSTLVLGVPGGFVPLKSGKGPANPEGADEHRPES